jgi:hypothetical protein
MKDDFRPFRPKPALVPVAVEPFQNQQQSDMGEQGESTYTEPEPASELPSPQPEPNDRVKQHKKRGPKAWWHRFQRMSRNKKIMVISALVGLLVFAGGLLWYYVLKAEPAPPPPPPVAKQEEPPKPTTVASRLTGVQIQPELNDLPSTGVMIENSPDARPQSGLYDAGVVFEAIAEGGITRFLALYQESKPEYIGPVRSVRPYYLDFLKPFDAPIAHAGGSGPALTQLRVEKFRDLEAFQNPAYYQRVNSRVAPHNLYSGRSRLLELQKKKGWDKSTYTGFVRKAEAKAATPTASRISLAISGFYYNPKFIYDPATNSYLREQAGKPHVDEKARKQINPKVVVVVVMTHRYSGVYSVYGTKGHGTAFIFQDGAVTKGIWEKKSRGSQFSFGDANGAPMGLNPGQTWVSVVSSSSAVVYKP